MTPIEVSVKVSDEEQTLTQKYLHYPQNSELFISHEDTELKRMVEETIGKFKGQPTDVIVKFKYVW
jgi:hypothetical protein